MHYMHYQLFGDQFAIQIFNSIVKWYWKMRLSFRVAFSFHSHNHKTITRPLPALQHYLLILLQAASIQR